jgi:hypothetical protein
MQILSGRLFRFDRYKTNISFKIRSVKITKQIVNGRNTNHCTFYDDFDLHVKYKAACFQISQIFQGKYVLEK